MPAPIRWDDSLSLDDQALDREHRELIGLAHALVDGPQLDRPRIEALLRGLGKYVRHHFAREEAHMRTIGYPQWYEHRLAHQAIVLSIERVLTRPDAGRRLRRGIDDLLRSWVADHIDRQDRAVAAWQRTRRLQRSLVPGTGAAPLAL